MIKTKVLIKNVAAMVLLATVGISQALAQNTKVVVVPLGDDQPRFRIISQPELENDSPTGDFPPAPDFGRLEFNEANSPNRNTQWGSVCDDGLSSSDTIFSTGTRFAVIACKAMGFKGGRHLRNRQVDDGLAPILLDQVNCPLGANRFSDCSSNPIGSHDCDVSENVGVACYNSTSFTLNSNKTIDCGNPGQPQTISSFIVEQSVAEVTIEPTTAGNPRNLFIGLNSSIDGNIFFELSTEFPDGEVFHLILDTNGSCVAPFRLVAGEALEMGGDSWSISPTFTTGANSVTLHNVILTRVLTGN